MTNQRQTLLSIGSFSKASQLSIKALRLYEQLGLLLPAFVDPDSGYRYYDTEQLRQARLVRKMRQIEMPLAAIRQALAAVQSDDTAEAERLVREYWQAREWQLEQGRRLVPDLIAALRKEVAVMKLEVQVVSLSPQPVVCLTGNMKVDRLEAFIWESVKKLQDLLESQGQPAAGAPFGLYHGPVNANDDGPVEVCLPVRAELPVPAGIATRTLPGGRAAAVVMEGEQCAFPAVLAGYDAVYDWIQANGYQEMGPPREVWHTPPGPEEKLEVLWPFQEPGSES